MKGVALSSCFLKLSLLFIGKTFCNLSYDPIYDLYLLCLSSDWESISNYPWNDKGYLKGT